MTHLKTTFCITTFNRVDCARINMEIIKLNYPNQWPIIHACSDKSYKKYIEDILVKCEPKAFQAGAFDLLRNSMLSATESYNPEYIVHLEADTWLMNQDFIEKYINLLSKNPNAIIASSS
jgi:spore coat polysaccharide biosynthesis protein SpsF (cytidylyltransferase family)